MQTSSVMRWHVTACRWSFAESTHSRHDNEDAHEQMECGSTASVQPRHMTHECARRNSASEKCRTRSLGFDLRPADCNLIAINASGARARGASRYYTSQHIGANKRSLYEMPKAHFLRRKCSLYEMLKAHFLRRKCSLCEVPTAKRGEQVLAL